MPRPRPFDVRFHDPAMSIGAVLLASGAPPSLDALRSLVSERHRTLPALSTKLTGTGAASRWQYCAPDIPAQVNARILAAGEDIREHARALQSEPYPSHTPLWDITLIHSPGNEGFALVYRVAHGLQDYGGLVRTLEVLFATESVHADASSAVPRSLVSPRRPSMRDWRAAGRTLSEVTGRIEPWSLASCGPSTGPSTGRACSWSSVPTGELREAANRFGGSSNDTYVAAVALAVQDWCADHLPAVCASPQKVVIAVNLRRPAQVHQPGNFVTGASVLLPAQASAAQVLRATAAGTAILKTAGHREALRRLVQRVPRVIDYRLSRRMLEFVQAEVTTSSFAVRAALDVLGQPVQEIEPLTILPSGSVSALLVSYGGRSNVVFVSDAALPKIHTLAAKWQRTVQTLAREEADTAAAPAPASALGTAVFLGT
jgi:diacylglycerol O-acyltransferase / wax synthase